MPTIETKYAIGDLVYSYSPFEGIYAFDSITAMHLAKDENGEIEAQYTCMYAGTMSEDRIASTLDGLYAKIRIRVEKDIQNRLNALDEIGVFQHKVATDTHDITPTFEPIGKLGDLITTAPLDK